MTTPNQPLRMSAYYFEFTPTGVPEIDLILSAVCRTGETAPHMADWAPSNWGPGDDGCPVEWIQNAANAAAAKRHEFLCELVNFIDPAPIEHDGKTMVFKNPLAAQALTGISAIVRAEVNGTRAQSTTATQDSSTRAEKVGGPRPSPVVAPPELPPLPEQFGEMQYQRPSGMWGRVEGYTRDQMQAYARQAVAEALARRDGK